MTHVVRRGPNGTALVTDGPYAETAEQLSGFYLVTTEDEAGLLDVAQVLLRSHPAVEIRPVGGDLTDRCRSPRHSRVIGMRGTLTLTTREDQP